MCKKGLQTGNSQRLIPAFLLCTCHCIPTRKYSARAYSLLFSIVQIWMQISTLGPMQGVETNKSLGEIGREKDGEAVMVVITVAKRKRRVTNKCKRDNHV
mmetsp:Transcript_16188/g.40959  ORF Transcript_16188/g.40959 Transcript_16188/m.40959 type:complete len:100 (+) Transcript_16188:2232-2531(+)